MENQESLEVLGLELVGAAALLLVTAGVVSFVLLRSARLKAPSMVVLAVSMLTLVALFGATTASTETATALITLAGVGLGGLVSALKSIFGDMEEQPPPRSVDDVPDDEVD
jgi:hypothetical protein